MSQGFFIRHIINYTGYNQKWNVKWISFCVSPFLSFPPCTLLSGISRQGNASVIPSGVQILPPALNDLEHQVMQIFSFPCTKSGQRNLYAQPGLIVMHKTPTKGQSVWTTFSLSQTTNMLSLYTKKNKEGMLITCPSNYHVQWAVKA